MQLPSPFNARAVQPASLDGGGMLPVGEHPVVITASELKETQNKDGGFLALTCTAIDGPAKGQSGVYRLNLYNQNAQAVQIAQRQLSALCYCVNVFDVTKTEDLHGKPFVVVVESQNDPQHPNRTQIRGVKDMAGNDPGKSANAAPQQTQQAGPPAAFQQPQQAAAPAAAWAAPAPAQQPAAAPAWGGNGAAAPAAPAAPQQAWQQPQTAAPAWAGAAPAGAAPAGNAPPWGQR